jgi:hypothetical protein
MIAGEPRVRRRGFFLHSTDSNESDAGEHDNPEGFPVRVRTNPSPAPRHFTGGRTARAEGRTDDGRPEIRSGSVTGSRQRAHLPR